MKDILPDEISNWHRLENAFRSCAERYGFREARFPIVEPTALFVRSIGETTDIEGDLQTGYVNLDAETLDRCFDLAHQLRNIPHIFARTLALKTW